MTVSAFFKRRIQSVFFGWWVVVGTIVAQILVSGLLLQTYGTYAAIWREEFGWSKTALAVAFALQPAVTGLLGPVQGWLLDRFGPRTVMRVGMILLGIGFILLSQIQSLTSFYLVFLLMALGASLSGILSLMTVIVNWFERRRSTALALMQVGASIGGLLVPLVAWSLLHFGWRPTAVVSGILILVVGLPIVQLMRRRPEDYGFLPDGTNPASKAPFHESNRSSHGMPQRHFTTRQALRTRAFWFLSVGHALAVMLVSTVLVHLVVYLNEGLGLSIPAAAGVFAFMTACTMLGQLSGGWLGDRFDKRLLAMLAMLAHAGALLALALAHSLIWVLVFALMHGLAWGMRGPQMGALRADYFGREAFATIMGFSSLIVMFGSMSGPILAGVIADTTGSYRMGFILLAALAATGSAFFWLAKRPAYD